MNRFRYHWYSLKWLVGVRINSVDDLSYVTGRIARGVFNRGRAIGRRLLGLDAGTHGMYAAWVAARDYRPDRDRLPLIGRVSELPAQPLISIVMPVLDAPAEYLDAAIGSVVGQVYPHWELCIADGSPASSGVPDILARHVARDARIRTIRLTAVAANSDALNAALALARGEWIGTLDAVDLLPEQALAEAAVEFTGHPAAALIYSDEDELGTDGTRHAPHFKPDFSRELLRSHNYIGRLTLYRAVELRAAGGWRSEFEGAHDYDLNLRIFERIDPTSIRHITKVLYHRRGGAAASAFAADAGLQALRQHVERSGLSASIEPVPASGTYRVRFSIPEPRPMVSIIIPTRDRLDVLRACIDSIRDKTTYDSYEIIVVDNGSTKSTAASYFRDLERLPDISVLPYAKPFNYAAINNLAVPHARGSIVALINNDVEVISPDWLSEMVSWACQPDIGCVGAKLYYGNDTVQHAGVILGLKGTAGHAHRHFARSMPGYCKRLAVVQNVSAVTGACLVVRKAIYEQVGGLDETNLKIAFNDVDFCLKVRRAGYLNVWTPFAELYHLESASRGRDISREQRARNAEEAAYMRKTWAGTIDVDPYYSPHLTRDREDFSIRF